MPFQKRYVVFDSTKCEVPPQIKTNMFETIK